MRRLKSDLHTRASARTEPRLRKALALLALAATSCSVISSVVGGVTGQTKKEEQKAELAEVQIRVMRFADTYTAQIVEGASQVPAATPRAQLTVVDWQLKQCTGAFDIASGANPAVNAIDMAILVTLTRAVVERYWLPQVFGEGGRPLLESLRELEPGAWRLLPAILKPEAATDLRAGVEQFIATHPDVREVAFLRSVDFVRLAALDGTAGLGKASEVVGSLGLDPFGGIDPAVRQVEESRILAERSLYFAKRWPQLLDLQAQKLTLELSLQPAPQRALDDVERVSRAAEAFGGVAAGLPELVAREREAAIRQFMDALQVEEVRARALLAEVRGTLDAGSGAARSIEEATRALDHLMATVSPPRPPGAPEPQPGKPFDIAEYTRALEQLGRTLNELQGLADSLDRNAPRVEAMVGATTQRATEEGRALVDHLFWRALTLVMVLLAGMLGVAVGYRWAATRIVARAGSRPG